MSSDNLSVKLTGECSCGAVRFELDCARLDSYVACDCQVCRKAAGWVNLPRVIYAAPGSLCVRGLNQVAAFKLPPSSRLLSAAVQADESGEKSQAGKHPDRCFCKICGSQLWLGDRGGTGPVSVFVTALSSPYKQVLQPRGCG